MIPINTLKNIRTFGSSMEPLLKENDIVYLKKIPFRLIKVNDIVAVKKYNKIVTHRVIYKTNSFIITKGDNNMQSDGKVYKRNVIGLITRIKREDSFFKPGDLYLFQSSLYMQEIIKIKEALEIEHIRFIFLKGLPLHLFYEKTYPKRIYGDCDILVHPNDLKKAMSIFKKHKYTYLDPKRPWDAYIHSSSQFMKLNFVKKVGNFYVIFDIHPNIAFLINNIGSTNCLYPNRLMKLFSDEMLNNRRLIRINNSLFPIPPFHYFFVFLLLHLVNHDYKPPYRYHIIITLLKHKGFCFKEILDLVHRYHLKNFVYPSFFYLQKYFGIKLPSFFSRAVQTDLLTTWYIKHFIFKRDFFSRKSYIKEAVDRFANNIFLSPVSLFNKIIFLFSPRILYIIGLILIKKVFSLFKKNFFLDEH